VQKKEASNVKEEKGRNRAVERWEKSVTILMYVSGGKEGRKRRKGKAPELALLADVHQRRKGTPALHRRKRVMSVAKLPPTKRKRYAMRSVRRTDKVLRLRCSKGSRNIEAHLNPKGEDLISPKKNNEEREASWP